MFGKFEYECFCWSKPLNQTRQQQQQQQQQHHHYQQLSEVGNDRSLVAEVKTEIAIFLHFLKWKIKKCFITWVFCGKICEAQNMFELSKSKKIV